MLRQPIQRMYGMQASDIDIYRKITREKTQTMVRLGFGSEIIRSCSCAAHALTCDMPNMHASITWHLYEHAMKHPDYRIVCACMWLWTGACCDAGVDAWPLGTMRQPTYRSTRPYHRQVAHSVQSKESISSLSSSSMASCMGCISV